MLSERQVTRGAQNSYVLLTIFADPVLLSHVCFIAFLLTFRFTDKLLLSYCRMQEKLQKCFITI